MDKKENCLLKGSFPFVKEENAYKEEIEVEEQRFSGVRGRTRKFEWSMDFRLLHFLYSIKTLENVLVDPGCITTIFDTDVLAKFGINNNLCLLCDKYIQSLTEVQ
ncbi:hypothetical protein QRE65_17190 [Bacillus cereus]|nr:hypothetical protein QRE65_17190 [Bacillus cereus]